MCGIIGVVIKANNGFIKQQEECFQQLLFVDTLRGDDSTGVIGVEKDSTFHIMKEATEAAWFAPHIPNSTLGRAMWSSGKAMIGHNRKKTIGDLKDETAHPFVINDVFAMVHNGTLVNHKKLADTVVDSEALGIVLSKVFEEKDYLPALELALGEVQGAYAVAMYDQKNHAIRLIRNNERPLAIVETPNAWYFASEGLMLQWILMRNGYKPEDIKSLRGIDENTLFTFNLDKTTLKEEKVVVKKPSAMSTLTQISTPTGRKSIFKKKVAVVTKEDDNLSKNEFKRIRRKLLATKVEFWAEDYVEANFPKTYDEGETEFFLMGVSDDIMETHVINAKINIAELALSPTVLCERLWKGRIEEVAYNTLTKIMTISIVEAIPLPTSPVIKQTVIDAEYIRRKLDEQEKADTIPTLH